MSKFKGVPGRVDVKVEVISAGDPRAKATHSDGREITLPTLAQLRQRAGGDELQIPDQTGAIHRISLKQYAHLDPNATHLLISDTFYPDHPFRKQDESTLQDPDFEKRKGK